MVTPRSSLLRKSVRVDRGDVGPPSNIKLWENCATQDSSERSLASVADAHSRHPRQDARSNYVEKATVVAQEQYTSLLTGLHAVGQVKGWKVQQLVFVGGTCGSVHVESFNKNMKALGVLESKWDLIRQKLVSRLLEEQDKVLRSYFAQKGGARSQRGEGIQGKGRDHVKWDIYA
jgi:hypothetical protein